MPMVDNLVALAARMDPGVKWRLVGGGEVLAEL